jgi:hypothetical protein
MSHLAVHPSHRSTKKLKLSVAQAQTLSPVHEYQRLQFLLLPVVNDDSPRNHAWKRTPGVRQQC